MMIPAVERQKLWRQIAISVVARGNDVGKSDGQQIWAGVQCTSLCQWGWRVDQKRGNVGRKPFSPAILDVYPNRCVRTESICYLLNVRSHYKIFDILINSPKVPREIAPND